MADPKDILFPYNFLDTPVLNNKKLVAIYESATTAPGVSDDSSAGYYIGHKWVKLDTDQEYTCLDDSVGAAVWTETTGGGGGDVATDTIWDAVGDLAVGSGADTAVALSMGTADQFLKVNAGGTNIAYEDLDISLDTTPALGGTLDFSNFSAQNIGNLTGRTGTFNIRTGTTASDELVFSGRDTDGSSWFDFITITAGTTPTMEITSPTFTDSPTLADNFRWTFNPGTTNSGLNVGAHTADPSSLVDGDVWYNSTTNKLRGRENGASVDLISAAATPGGATTNIQFNLAGAFAGSAKFTWTDASNLLTVGDNSGDTEIRLDKADANDASIKFFNNGGGNSEIVLNASEVFSMRADNQLELVSNGRVAVATYSAGLTAANVEIGDNNNSFGAGTAGEGVLRLNDVLTVPVGTLTSGGLLYVSGLDLIYHDDAGNTTTLTGGLTVGGSPVDNQVAVFTGASEVEGNVGFTYDSTGQVMRVGDGTLAGPEIVIDADSTAGAGKLAFHEDSTEEAAITYTGNNLEYNVPSGSSHLFKAFGATLFDLSETGGFASQGLGGGRLVTIGSGILNPVVGRTDDTNTGLGADGSDGVSLVSNSKGGVVVTDAGTKTNVELFGTSGGFGATTAGEGVLRLNDVATVPAGTMTNGGLLYVNGTNLYYHADDGTVKNLTDTFAIVSGTPTIGQMARFLTADTIGGDNDVVWTGFAFQIGQSSTAGNVGIVLDSQDSSAVSITFNDGGVGAGSIEMEADRTLNISAFTDLHLKVSALDAIKAKWISGSANVEFFGSVDDYGATTAGENVIRINDVSVIPSGALASGGLLYVSGTALYFYDDSGTAHDLTAGGSGNVSNSGTPVNDQLAVWVDATTIEGTTALTFNGSQLGITASSASLVITSSTTSGPNSGPFISLWSKDGAAIAIGDRVGNIQFGGENNVGGTALGAEISAFATAAYSLGDAGTELRFITANNGGLSTSTKMVVNVNVELFGNNQDFGATTAGEGVLRLNDVTTAPAGTLASGGLLYVSGTALYFYDDSGTAHDLTAGGSGNVSNSGTPVNDQLAIWVDATTIEGQAGLTFASQVLTVGDAGVTNPEVRVNRGILGTARLAFHEAGTLRSYIEEDSSEILNIYSAGTSGNLGLLGTPYWYWTGSTFGGFGLTGGNLNRTGTSLTVPFVHRGTDSNSGIGGNGSDSISIISNSKQAVTSTDAGLATNVELLGFNNDFGITTAGEGVLRLNDVATVPAGTLLSGGLLYVSGTSLFFHADDGTAHDLTASGSGNVSNSGTPADSQLAVWVNATTIEGDAKLTYATVSDTLLIGDSLLSTTTDIGLIVNSSSTGTLSFRPAGTTKASVAYSASGKALIFDTVDAGTSIQLDINATSYTFDETELAMGGDVNMQGNNITDVHEVRLDGLPDTDHTANGPTTDTFNAGSTISIGQILYMGSVGEWFPAEADLLAGSGPVMLAIALAAGTDGNPLKVALPGSFVRDDSWAWTVGAELYISITAGSLTETAPTGTDNVVRVVGYAVSADVIYFNPGTSWITHT